MARPSRWLLSISILLASAFAAPAIEAAATIGIGDLTLPEGTGGTTDFVFTVMLSETSGSTVTVDYATRNGNAVAGTDYLAASGTVTFLPGETSRPITVQVIGDTDWENSEHFYVDLSNAVGASISDTYAVGWISNDDVRIEIGDLAQAEGTGGTTDFVFDVTLSAPYHLTVTVDFATRHGSALADVDYLTTSGTVTFPPGVTTQPITVQVVGDTDWENTEYFYVDLTNATNSTIWINYARGWINNDDVRIEIGDLAQAEGTGGTTDFVFDVTLSAPYGLTVTVDFATRQGSALADVDYLSTSGTVTFPPGVTTQPITVQVVGDTDWENTEYFYVDLTNATNSTIWINYGRGWINDDDVRIAIADLTQAEGTGGTTDFVFDVTLSAPYHLTVTVDFATRPSSATADIDYLSTSGTVTFPPGVTTQPITVQVVGDTDWENTEYFYVDLTNATNSNIWDNYAVGWINDDDVRIAIGDLAQAEGTGGTTDFVFDVTLSAPYHLTVTVDYATRDGGAVAGADYIATSGTATFPPGATSQPVTVEVIGDTEYEAAEYFYLDLTSAVNASIGDPYAAALITNDDVRIAISNVSQAEGTGGTTDFDFDVTLSAPYHLTVTVDYATRDGGALAGEDYIATSGTVTFLPGETSQPATVQVIADDIKEFQEHFYVDLTNATNASLYIDYAVGWIDDDDAPPALSISNVSQGEGNSGTGDFIFTVTLTPAGLATVTVDYATADGSAEAPSDYATVSGTLTFDPGVTERDIIVPVVGDVVYELDEFFYVNLTNPVEATISDGTGYGSILNDEPEIEISIDDVSLSEGHVGTTDFTFTIDLSGVSDLTTSLDYYTSGGTATPGVDYGNGAGTVTFPPGVTSLPLVVAGVCDIDYEIDETFFVDLSNPANAIFSDSQGLGTILNDEPLCTPRAGHVYDLQVERISAGTELYFSWTDLPGADHYVLYEAPGPTGPCLDEAGTAASGTVGITVPAPATDMFYLLAAGNSACGLGARRLCVHDKCVTGVRLDSACDLCVHDICAVEPACCSGPWTIECIERVRIECGSLRCSESQGACAHTLCSEGVALTASCDEPPLSPGCVAAICAVDSSCCTTAWSSACVGMVSSVCGMNCD